MCNYDFEILQYNEFENLTRDLLQKEFSIFIESFKDGKDGGIDLRFGINEQDKCIVQVKRYKDWSSLKRQLEVEVKKVQTLIPERYILSTSVPLSPGNKETIKKMFAPYIKDTADILGRNDLANLLSKHSDIERKYYKLWLASTNVLKELVHKDVRNWSDFELDTIRETIKTYVMNDSFTKALEILKEHRYVIISGIPGIGKTTLARILAYDLLARGYEEFVCIENDLKDGARLFQEDKRQVFFFDDFLGSNTFFQGEKDFENKLVSFIKAIKRNPGKLFIMTTREYILAQAKEYYERFQINKVDIAKCTLDLSAYSPTIRAKILYNHVAEAHLPIEYIEQLIKNKNYMRIVEHKCFNPRVIEMYIDRGEWQKDKPENFIASFVRLFNKPTCVWERAFKSLNKEAKYALLVLGSMGCDVHEEDWHEAFLYFMRVTEKELKLQCTDDDWQEVIRVLEDCFIRTSRSKGQKKLVVKLFNPSVHGFIVEYISSHKDVQGYLLRGARYVEQLSSIFTTDPSLVKEGDAYVLISPEMERISYARLEEIVSYDGQITCRLESFYQDRHLMTDIVEELYDYLKTYGRNAETVRNLISKEDLEDVTKSLTARLFFLKKLNWDGKIEVRDEIIESIRDEEMEVNEYCEFTETLHELHRDDILYDAAYLSCIKASILKEIDDNLSSTDDTQSLSDIVDRLSNILPVDAFPRNDLLGRIEEEEERIRIEIEEFYDWDSDMGADNEIDEKALYELMSSLRVQED